ncbi:MAG TPA: hypothetical protein VFR24_27515 [Candidatus Angelobacter sp.]|nr:hypothetical protein [Candidatus Angelobacter sp.]
MALLPFHRSSISFLCVLSLTWALAPAQATYKPEYEAAPQAVREWFQHQLIMPAAQPRLGWVSCCDHADRLRTKFVGTNNGDTWYYYTDPNCTQKGCKLARIPDDVIHPEEIRALDPKDDQLPEFDQMREEGVLMIFASKVTCFWPPQTGI